MRERESEPRNLHFEVHKSTAPAAKSALRGSESAAPGTSRFTCGSPAKAFRRKNASKDNVQIPKRSFRARLPPVSDNQTHVEKSRFTAPVTK